MKFILGFLLAFFMPILAFAQEVVAPIVEQDPDIVKFFPVLIEAIKNGQWLVVGAIVTIVVVFGIKKFILPKLGLGNGLLPLISAVLGVILGVGIAVASGAPLVPSMLAVLSGPLASTLYDALVKYFFKK